MKPFPALRAAALATAALSVLVLALVPAAARADARASVRLSNFGYTLLDLNPDDDEAPWVRFERDTFDSNAGVSVQQWRLGADGLPLPRSDERSEGWGLHHGRGFFPALDRSVSLSHTQASAHQSGSIEDGSFGFTFEGRARNALGGALWGSNFLAGGSPVFARRDLFQGHYAIELGPWTELAWTGTLTVEAEKDSLRREYAQAQGRFRVTDAWGRSTGVLSLRADTRAQPAGLQRHSDALEFYMSNWSSDVTHGRLIGRVSAWGGTSTGAVPVPEPGTWALLAGGLGVVGAVAARRRAPPPPRA